MQYFKRSVAEGPNQEEMEQIWKYLDGLFSASVACGALFVVILKQLLLETEKRLNLQQIRPRGLEF